MNALVAEPVILGRLSGLHGIRGAFKVFSYTEPREAICDYPDWLIRRRDGWRSHRLLGGHRHGRTVLARLEGIEDRDAALAFLDAEVGVTREAMPAPADGEYYWADLIGMRVTTTEGDGLGRVQRLFTTGANDVLVVVGERERWLPFLTDRVVRNVDFGTGEIRVDWEPDW